MVKEQNQINTHLEDDPPWDYLKNNQDEKWTIEVKVYDSDGDVLNTMLYDLVDLWSMYSNEKYDVEVVGDGDTMKIYKESLA